MTLLPIQFRTNFKKSEYKDLNAEKVLGLVQNYLREKEFNYIQRKENKIVFHAIYLFTWPWFNIRLFLVSGIVKVKDSGKSLTVINGNRMVFLIALPFVMFLLAAQSKFSTFDENDLELIRNAFLWIFIGNLIVRIIAHLSFRHQIEELVRKHHSR